MSHPLSFSDIVTALQDLFLYPGARQVEKIETHISVVLLAGDKAYKLKKPVVYDFVDFSTLSARQKACEQEILLNRRMAPEIYEDLVAIGYETNQGLNLEGRGQVVEFAVKMKRLDASCMLDHLILQKKLGPAQTSTLAKHLADYYSACTGIEISHDEYCKRSLTHIRANRKELLNLAQTLKLDAIKIERAHCKQLGFALLGGVLEQRVKDRHIIDGHGDLRPANICLQNPPIVFDCIEFNPEYRMLDVADELSFLSIEAEVLGAPELSQEVLQAYQTASHDWLDDKLVNYFKSYRALVRAKVSGYRILQTEEQNTDELQRLSSYIELADRYAQSIHPTQLISIGGYMGSGKTHCARWLTNELGARHLQTDQIRRELDPKWFSTREDFGEGRYTFENRERVYQMLADRVSESLQLGISVVADGTFSQPTWRHMMEHVAKDLGVPHTHIWCTCPPDLARQRIEHRAHSGNSLSEARPEHLEKQIHSGAPPTALEVALTLDTSQPESSNQLKILSYLRSPPSFAK